MSDDDNLQQWRAELREWLAATLPPRGDEAEPSTDFAVFQNISEDAERELLDRVRAYRRARYDAGYGALALAADVGGGGLSMRHVIAYTAEERAFAVPPSTELISVTCGLVGPTMATFGTDEQRQRFATAFLRSDLLCCQLFSEPGAGSDLAAVATRATRAGDGWVIEGQKVWTSGARFADYGLLLARTDPDVAKQAGLTMFLVPMDAPGVEIRPIKQMSGASSFNEVFLSGVALGNDMRVGPIGAGWKVANTTLGFERTASGQGTRRKGGSFDDLLGLARHLGRADDPVVRQQLADVYLRTRLREATTDRVARANAAGATPGPAASIGKLVASQTMTLIGDVAMSLLGARGVADTGEAQTFGWTEHLLGAPGYRLAGGTDEIQRTIIGERVLGLPKEPRADAGVPYSQLPRGG